MVHWAKGLHESWYPDSGCVWHHCHNAVQYERAQLCYLCFVVWTWAKLNYEWASETPCATLWHLGGVDFSSFRWKMSRSPEATGSGCTCLAHHRIVARASAQCRVSGVRCHRKGGPRDHLLNLRAEGRLEGSGAAGLQRDWRRSRLFWVSGRPVAQPGQVYDLIGLCLNSESACVGVALHGHWHHYTVQSLSMFTEHTFLLSLWQVKW